MGVVPAVGGAGIVSALLHSKFLIRKYSLNRFLFVFTSTGSFYLVDFLNKFIATFSLVFYGSFGPPSKAKS
jgi:hypothetical protein